MRFAEIRKRFELMREFFGLVRDRKVWILLPLLGFIILIVFFVFAAEMPALIPFFYAVF